MSRGRNHGVFAVSSDVVELPSKNHETKRDSLTISNALESVFQQMRIVGNRQRTIETINTSLNSSHLLTSYSTLKILL